MIHIPGGTFDDQGHVYRNARGSRVLSVTQVFGMLGLVDYDAVKPEVLERKSRIGVAVHKAVEYLTEGSLDWDSVNELAMPFVVAADEWIRTMQYQSLDREQQGIHTINGMAFGFQYDHRGKMIFQGRDRHVILDLKTCDKESPTWCLQTAAYAMAAPPLPAGERYLRAVLQLKPDSTLRCFYYDDPADQNSFLYMLYCAIWKQNRHFKEAA